jgi:hypothetical protein
MLYSRRLNEPFGFPEHRPNLITSYVTPYWLALFYEKAYITIVPKLLDVCAILG